ncbi:MAG: NnrU family protein [bacterium]
MGVTPVILASSLFAATHLGMSHGEIRRQLVQKLGERRFRGLYILVSFMTLGGAIWAFSTRRGEGPVLWTTPAWIYPVVYLLMLLALALFILSFFTPSPTGMAARVLAPRGVLRITRHPMNMGFALFGLAHVIANGSLADLFFFGSFFVVGFLGAYHQDRRKALELGPAFSDFRDQTSVLPFAAVLQGRTRLVRDELPLAGLAVALVLYGLLIAVHGRLFGAEPF